MTQELTLEIKAYIRDIVDYPKKGIIFKDLTPILQNPKLCKQMAQKMAENFQNSPINAIAGIESRGFWFGMLLAQEMDLPFIPIRKKGKLPYKTFSQAYDLEYGSATLEIHTDALQNGAKVLIHDDLLATGGSASACAQLIKKAGGDVIGFSFLVNLAFLNGQQKLYSHSQNIHALVSY